MPEPAFARDPATSAYYDARAAEYDEWYLGRGRFALRDRPGWDGEVAALVSLVQALPPARTLDVACGSGFLTGTCAGRSSSGGTRARRWSPSRSRGCRTAPR